MVGLFLLIHLVIHMSSYEELMTSPVVGATTAAVAIGAAYLMYRQRHARSPQPVKQLTGTLRVSDVSATDERKRDLVRFVKSGNVILKSAGGDVTVYKAADPEAPDRVVRDLVKLLPSGADIDGLVYSISTSIGMDILLKIGISPPIISQPIFVVHTSTGVVELVGFVGSDIKGAAHPDFKFTDWVIRMRLDSRQSRVEYEIRYGGGCDKSTDFI